MVSWPKGIKAKGEMRRQYQHIIDISPTILEAAGETAPKCVGGVSQQPIDGISMAYTFDAAKAADRRRTQYYELWGNRGIRSEEHTSELQSLMRITYAVFCLKKKMYSTKKTTYTM